MKKQEVKEGVDEKTMWKKLIQITQKENNWVFFLSDFKLLSSASAHLHTQPQEECGLASGSY